MRLLGEAAISTVNVLLNDKDPTTRIQIADEILNIYSSKGDIDSIINLTRHRDANIRLAAYYCLGPDYSRSNASVYENPKAKSALYRGAQDPHPKVRETVVLLLSEDGQAAVPCLWHALSDNSKAVRKAALQALKNVYECKPRQSGIVSFCDENNNPIMDYGDRSVMERTIQSPDPKIRTVLVADYLYTDVNTLMRLLDDKDPNVRWVAALSLGKACFGINQYCCEYEQQYQENAQTLREIMHALQLKLIDPDYRVREAVKEVLTVYGKALIDLKREAREKGYLIK